MPKDDIDEILGQKDVLSDASISSSGPAVRQNIDEEIEKNLLIKTMPKRFKVSAPDKQRSKTKAVGAVIMVVGLLIMVAGAYLVYAFLINPKKPATPAPKPVPQVSVPTPTPPVSPAPDPVPQTPIVPETQTPAIATSTTPTIIDITQSTSSQENVIIEESTATQTPPIVPSVPASSLDSDGDGLSDAEEMILGTNPNNVDTDGDGYSDKAEFENLYNPAGPGKLEDNPNISRHSDSAGYSILRPSSWIVQKAGDSIIVTSPDTSFVQFIVEANTERKDVLAWFSQQFSDTSVSASDVVVKNGWEGIYHKDANIFYLVNSDKSKIVTIAYIPKEEGDNSYYNIFRMMINSFVFEAGS